MPHSALAVDPANSELAKLLLAPETQALFVEEARHPAWLDELKQAVEQGLFHVQRTELTGVDIDTIGTWLDRNLPRNSVSEDTRNALISDILRLAQLIEDLTSAHCYKLRIFTAEPDHRCGFHVDTVPPNAPVWGALRVYNGYGTDWVEPTQVRSMAAFYHWLQLRDRLVRLRTQATRDAKLKVMDEHPEFLLDGAQIQRVHAETTVIFRHLNAADHWSDHPARQAWIHSSPTHGPSRLVVNVSPHRQSMA